MAETTKVSVGVKLTALVDGTTIQGSLLSTKPLVQGYKEADKEAKVKDAIPDFAKDSTARPTIYFVVNDISSGDVFPATSVKNLQWKYNGQPFGFDESGLCNNPDFPGLFKQITYEYEGVLVHAIEVVDNFPFYGNYDNDVISVEGSVEVSGTVMWVKNVTIPVVIQPSLGNVYALQLSDTHGFQIPADDAINSTETTAALMIDGKQATDTYITNNKIKFLWKKIVGGSAVDFGEGKTKIITKKDVDNVLIVKCSVVKGDTQTELATVYQSYTDKSDPYFIVTKKTDKNNNNQPLEGTVVPNGHTAVITPELRSRGGRTPYAGSIAWSFTPYDNNGNVYTGTPAIQTFPNYCEVSHAAVVAAKRNMNIIIDADITI